MIPITIVFYTRMDLQTFVDDETNTLHRVFSYNSGLTSQSLNYHIKDTILILKVNANAIQDLTNYIINDYKSSKFKSFTIGTL